MRIPAKIEKRDQNLNRSNIPILAKFFISIPHENNILNIVLEAQRTLLVGLGFLLSNRENIAHISRKQ